MRSHHRTLFLSLLLAACGSPTQLVVLVDSDYEVPEELAGAEVSVVAEDGAMVGAESFDLAAIGVPMSFGIEPTKDLIEERVRVSVRGLAPSGALLVERVAVVGFVAGERRLLPMFLARSCTGMGCGIDQTCTERGCAPVSVDVEDLQKIDPGDEAGYDAGVHADAGEPNRDASAGEDADVGRDAGVDEDASIDEDAETRDGDAIADGGDAQPDTGPPDVGPPDIGPGCNFGDACEDGDLCTQGDTCDQAGTCISGPMMVCLDDGTQCTVESCDPQSGQCVVTSAPDDTPCDDFDLCTDGDFCQGGTCVGGVAVQCPDDMSFPESCREAYCDPAIGCTTRPLPDLSGCQGQGNRQVCCGGSCFDTQTQCCTPLMGGGACCTPVNQCVFVACNDQNQCVSSCCP